MLGVMRDPSVSSLLVICLLGSVALACPQGDLSGNCRVDWEDLQLLTDRWLDLTCVAPECEADLDGIPGVTVRDFSLLAKDWMQGQVTLVINEFQAQNDSTIQDPCDNDWNDWIEIYNYGNFPIDMAGMYLTDDLYGDPNDWSRIPHNYPDDTTVPAGGFLLIWADNENQGPLHVNFKLSAGGGEDVALIDTDQSTVIDSIIGFPAQNADESYGRLPDASDNWVVFSHTLGRPPTPGKSNQGQPTDIVINEIMYHPYHSTDPYEPEPRTEEYIELYNRGTAAVNLLGWRFCDGVDFTFPDITLGPGQYLVVAADVNAFAAKYPSVTNFVGGWIGRLSNSGEVIELLDNAGARIDRLRYADQGEWSVRELGPLDRGHRGWIWLEEHDGGGKSLELVNAALPNEYGQNWLASDQMDGTPGLANSVADADAAPLIADAKHSPFVPGPNDPVTVAARIVDELTTGITVTLHYRVDTSVYVDEGSFPHHDPNDYTHLTMYDDGTHGDNQPDDGEYTAQVPAQADGTIIEFYIEAGDAMANSRTWPAPAMMDGTPEQVTNALYQVDDSFHAYEYWVPGSQPIYYIIMTEMERGRMRDMVADSDHEGPNCQMNATFISADGVDVRTRYNVGVRNRGHGTRNDWPNNYRVNFAHDQQWKDVTAINLNIVYTWLQLAGNAILQMSGVAQCEATAVQVRTNGENLALLGGTQTYGSYVHLEVIDTDFADNHYPTDDAGNAYKCMRITHEADLRYEGSDADPYRANYFKRTNTAEDDWSDLIGLTYALDTTTPDESYVEEVKRVMNTEQWLRFIAINALMNNRETTLANGNGDDYYLYRGVEDTRFVLIQHDLDSAFGLGQNPGGTTDPIFEATDIPTMKRFIEHPEFAPRYYFHLKNLVETTFSAEQLGPFLDNLLARFVPTSRINQMKDFVATRNAYVLSLIPSELTIETTLPQSSGYYYTTSSSVDISGEADAVNTRSIRVNGMPVAYSPFDGAWNTGTGLPGELLLSLPIDTTWSYEQSDTDLGTAWRDPNYDDSSWPTGQALLYVEGAGLPGPKNTPLTIGATTYYFRTKFNFKGDPNEVALLQFYTILDDGAVIYLNGNEVNPRVGIDPGPISHGDYADRTVGDATREGPFTVLDANLVHGDNVIAVEVHQSSAGSTDIVWGMELRAYAATTSGDVPLQPGINRIIVQAFDDHNGTGNELESEYIDIWYDDGNDTGISGTLPVNTVLNPASGPWRVTGDIIVPSGVTLTILPGTTLFFEAGTGITVQSGGRLLANGTPYRRIRLTRVPGAGSPWDGLKFDNSLTNNLLASVDMEYGDGQGESIDMDYSKLLAENSTWGGTDETVFEVYHPSLIVRNSYLPGIANSEVVHGEWITGSEYLILENNVFGVGTATGDDIVDFSGSDLPGPVFQAYNNIFLGGGDDALDIDGVDALVEGNIFMNFHWDGIRPTTAQAIATGQRLGLDSDVVAVRNIIIDCDHGALVKEDCFLHAENNVFVGCTEAAIQFHEPGGTGSPTPGRGAYLDGNIFYNNNQMFKYLDQATEGAVMNRCIAPASSHYLGVGNIDADPLFLDPNSDFRLKSMSPAIGTGPCGLDIGAYVPGGAALSGEPGPVTYHTNATLTVRGPGITHYKYCLNDPNGPWSGEFSVDIPIALAGLLNRQSYTVYAIGKNYAGVWQSEDSPTASRTWTVDTSFAKLVINEVLAHTHGTDPDIIELYYDGPAPLNLTDMSLTDNPGDPRKFVFSSQTVLTTIMNPGDYMILYGDPYTHIRNHLGFALSAEGEGLYLYDKPANGGGLLDSIEFGLQINNYSIGRVGYNREWKLNQPTFGAANIAQPLGDPARLRINEWLANGEVLFADDFIEIYNPQNVPVDLSGLYLTDDPVTQPAKHRIAQLAFVTGGGYAVLIADGDPEDGPNHLNFRLSAHQEVIGLFHTQLNQIDQVICGPQATDVSHGCAPEGSKNHEFFILPTPGVSNTWAAPPAVDYTLVSSRATVEYCVPADATWESTWMLRDFNGTATWKTGQTPLGFGYSTTPMTAYNDCVYDSADQYIAAYVTTYGIGSGYSGPTSGTLLDQATGTDMAVTATLSQSGGVTWQESPASGGSDCAAGTDAYNTFSGIADMTGVIYYGSAGWWVDLTFTGLDPTTEYTFATSAARCNYTGRLTIYTITGADSYTNASTPGVDVLAANKVRFNTGDNYNEGYVARWTGITASDGTFTVRAEADPCCPEGRKAYSFDVFMLEQGQGGSDLETDMLGINTTAWSRIEFDVDDPSIFSILTLRMKYEDGFVAYLNGTEVARSYFTGTPHYNSVASGSRPNHLALQYEDFDISSHISDLEPGRNVLAIHGLNDNINDEYFRIQPELLAVSDPNENPYLVALSLLDGLRVTEMMYHDPSGSDYDYIELQNISDTTLNLTGIRFLEGILFTFPTMTLGAGQYVVVYSNRTAFEARYGTSINAVGPYTGNLSNGGEDILLTLAWPLEAAIMRYEYDDAWYPSTDGGGHSLVIRDPNAHPRTWDQAESWQAAPPSPGGP